MVGFFVYQGGENMRYAAVLEYDLINDIILDWEFATEKEALDFADICLKQGYTMRLESRNGRGD